MNNQIFIVLKRKLAETLSEYGQISVEAQRNAMKEVLQYYVLNFIYNSRDYSNWIMYGGSALRICHKLDRMSVDLDFEVDHAVSNDFLNKLKKEIAMYFENNYQVGPDILSFSLTNNRGIVLKFNIAKELGLSFHSNQVHVKIDLNYFVSHPKVVIERRPQNEYQLSFVIKTYNMSALMASKIAAIFLRGQRGVGKELYEEKGRDIYDLLWYMTKKVLPDLDYLKTKDVKEAEDLRTLFDKLTIKMNSVSDENLKQDLTPLFGNQMYIQNWLKNWRDSYISLLEDYKINIVTTLEKIKSYQDFDTDVYFLIFYYKTGNKKSIKVIYRISYEWVSYNDLQMDVDKNTKDKFTFDGSYTGAVSPENKLLPYAELFYRKTEDYFKKTKQVMLGDMITTKLIRTNSNNFNPNDQILLNESTLLRCELEDLVK